MFTAFSSSAFKNVCQHHTLACKKNYYNDQIKEDAIGGTWDRLEKYKKFLLKNLKGRALVIYRHEWEYNIKMGLKWWGNADMTHGAQNMGHWWHLVHNGSSGPIKEESFLEVTSTFSKRTLHHEVSYIKND